VAKQGTKSEVGYKKPPREHRIKKGQVLNPNGRPTGTSLTAIIKRVLAEPEGDGTKADKLIEVAIKAARRGDYRFWNALIERNDGKVPDRIADADGNKLIVEVQYVDAPRSTDTE
jgi:hypothetical protein